MTDMVAKALLMVLTAAIAAVCVLVAARHGGAIPRLPGLGGDAL